MTIIVSCSESKKDVLNPPGDSAKPPITKDTLSATWTGPSVTSVKVNVSTMVLSAIIHVPKNSVVEITRIWYGPTDVANMHYKDGLVSMYDGSSAVDF